MATSTFENLISLSLGQIPRNLGSCSWGVLKTTACATAAVDDKVLGSSFTNISKVWLRLLGGKIEDIHFFLPLSSMHKTETLRMTSRHTHNNVYCLLLMFLCIEHRGWAPRFPCTTLHCGFNVAAHRWTWKLPEYLTNLYTVTHETQCDALLVWDHRAQMCDKVPTVKIHHVNPFAGYFWMWRSMWVVCI